MTLQETIGQILGYSVLYNYDGWSHGEGLAVNPIAVERAVQIATSHGYRYAHPTLTGGVQFEGEDFEHEVYADGRDERVDWEAA